MDTGQNPGQGPQNREELLEALTRLRAEGAIDEAEETTLIRHYDELQHEYKAELAKAEPEFLRRCEQDGKEAATKWLAGMAHELGRRQGEATRKITDQLRVVTG